MNKKIEKQSTAQFFAELCGDNTIAADIEKNINETRLIATLISARVRKGFKQKDIAKVMGVSASTISRIEDSRDMDLCFGDILKYIQALGMDMSMFMDDASDSTTRRIKHCVFMIEKLLQNLTNLARKCDDDESIVDGIAHFRAEVLYNFLLRYKSTGDNFPFFATANKDVDDESWGVHSAVLKSRSCE